MKKITMILFLNIVITSLIFAQTEFLEKINPSFNHVTHLVFNSSSEVYAAVWNEFPLYKSTDAGITWNPVAADPYKGISSVIATTNNNLFIGSTGITITGIGDIGRGFFHSTNSGESWIKINNIPEPAGYGTTSTGELLVSTSDGLYRTTDNGLTWKHSYVKPTRYRINGKWTTKDVVASNILTDSKGNLFFKVRDRGLFRSDPRGKLWIKCLPAVKHGDVFLPERIAIDNHDNIIVGGFGSFFRSTTHGKTWKKLNFPRDLAWNIRGIEISSNGNIYVTGASFSGILCSTDNGNTWTNIAPSLPDYEKGEVLTLSPDGYLYYCTLNNGIYRSVQPVSSSPSNTTMTKPENITTTYTLSQNYPNPFNPSTVINYQLAVSGFVSLTVYNTLGEAVATLVNETQDAGFKSVTFDASTLPSGVYTYRLQSGDFSAIKKLLLIK